MNRESPPERDRGVGLAHPTVVPENYDPETGTVRTDDAASER